MRRGHGTVSNEVHQDRKSKGAIPQTWRTVSDRKHPNDPVRECATRDVTSAAASSVARRLGLCSASQKPQRPA
eukprot:4327054-Prymnesium_polylepis.1